MRLLTEYLTDAVKFRQMASEETDPKLKAALEEQSAAYWKLAEKRARDLGVPLPDRLPQSK